MNLITSTYSTQENWQLFENQARDNLKTFETKRFSSESPYGFLHTPYDTAMLQEILDLVQKKQALQPSAVILVGIGGSLLGTLALYDACLKYSPIKIPFHYADTLDTQLLEHTLNSVDTYCANGTLPLIIIVSKSGSTLETMVNATFILERLQRYEPNHYQQHVVAITNNNTSLWNWSLINNIDSLTIPEHISGRFSVFTASCLFPLAMLGLTIHQLLEGARTITDTFFETTNNSSLIKGACLHHTWYWNGLIIHDIFLWSPILEKLGMWYRQLFGESLGKRYDLNNNEIRYGSTPTVSIGTTDLHSMFQLTLGGPGNKSTCFVYASESNQDLIIPPTPLLQTNSTVTALQHAVRMGVQEVYKEQELPFVAYDLKTISAFTLGQWMQLKMIETALIAALANINAFDQPEVERYKNQARNILNR